MLKQLLTFILDLLFPLRCLRCGRADVWLCEKCSRELPLNSSYERCEKVLTFSACDYQKAIIKKIIKTCKFSAIPELANVLGKLLLRAILRFPEIKDLLENTENLIIVPIPLSPRRARERDFNQSLIIAQIISAHFKLPLLDNLRKDHRPPQAELAGKKRNQNIQGAFSWHGPNLSGQKIILVDDVVTTGATLSEAALTLKKAGAERVIGLAVAR